MRFEEKLKTLSQAELWQEYCGFLDLSMGEYMNIQKRLLMEQVKLMGSCPLGKRLFHGHTPETVEEFRRTVPLTDYSDYSDTLLLKHAEELPTAPVVWLKTTWEGGDSPSKLAPYSQSMLDTYKANILSAMILSTSTGRGRFSVRSGARVLYALAPMPYATGLFPELIDPELKLRFLPPVKEAQKMSFTQQTKKGFQMSLSGGMSLFFGMSSVIYHISKTLLDGTDDTRVRPSTVANMSGNMMYKILAAKYRAKRDGVAIRPGDIYDLDGFVCVGTDSARYKDELEALWGLRPLEIAGGAEPSCMGTETWSKNGLVLFPDTCFYEFIPENEMLRSLKDKAYEPKTYLMDELTAGECYEIVLTVLKGGVFTRYRVGDVYRCLRLSNHTDGIELPQFEYVDRIPTVIDIAGFTRITEKEVSKVIDLSHLPIHDWFATKEYDEHGHSYMHLYAEMSTENVQTVGLGQRIIKEHLGVYFRYYDGDYEDLKRLLGLEPLQVTILKTGTIARYNASAFEKLPRINPRREDVLDVLHLCTVLRPGEEDVVCR